MNIAVYLKSESCDSYLYLYSVEEVKEVIDKLTEDSYEFQNRCICDFEVESNDREVNVEITELILDYLDSEEGIQ